MRGSETFYLPCTADIYLAVTLSDNFFRAFELDLYQRYPRIPIARYGIERRYRIPVLIPDAIPALPLL
jgi:hypothetical protein